MMLTASSAKQPSMNVAAVANLSNGVGGDFFIASAAPAAPLSLLVVALVALVLLAPSPNAPPSSTSSTSEKFDP
jgi:hypothetical protein